MGFMVDKIFQLIFLLLPEAEVEEQMVVELVPVGIESF
jgi:hypothetical protein